MSDKTDPRLEVLAELFNDSTPRWPASPSAMAGVAADLDDADRAAGIVRVDTRDEALVERVAKVMYEHPGGHFPPWNDAGDIKNVYRAEARAILAALREAS